MNITIDNVRKLAEKRGDICLSSYYKNNEIKLKFVCSNNHEFNISWHHYSRGQGCAICSGKLVTFDMVVKTIEDRGDICLSSEYIHSKAHISIQCGKCGYINNTVCWSNYSHGVGCKQCSILGRSGPKHPNWKGGISVEPYCDAWADRQYKEDIKIRDNYTCQNEYCWRTTEKLTIHHINYNKKDCLPKNLITLCKSCNSRANKDRDLWQIYYKRRNKENDRIYKCLSTERKSIGRTSTFSRG